MKIIIAGHLAITLVSVASAQRPEYEATFLVGGRYGGSMSVEQPSTPNVEAKVISGISYGLSGAVRFQAEDEGYNVIGFRWLRQSTNLRFTQEAAPPTPEPRSTTDPFRPAVVLDHFLADFTREYRWREFPSIQPFITASVGAARLSVPDSSGTRFAFAIGGGVNIFPKKHWGLRIGAEYLPTVMYANVEQVVCIAACGFILNGGLMNQFQMSIGPSFRF